MTDCICVYPLTPQLAARIQRINPPCCPLHGGTGKWAVIPT